MKYLLALALQECHAALEKAVSILEETRVARHVVVRTVEASVSKKLVHSVVVLRGRPAAQVSSVWNPLVMVVTPNVAVPIALVCAYPPIRATPNNW
jgi:hypothetical protein